LWGKGHVEYGRVTTESAAYTASYTLKKVYGREAEEWYAGRVPEYMTMSRRPGIGSIWLDRYMREVYIHDSCIVDGREVKPPDFYDERLRVKDEALYTRIKVARKKAQSDDPNSTGRQLLVREEVSKARMATFTRRSL
jgi:hypothetical protein